MRIDFIWPILDVHPYAEQSGSENKSNNGFISIHLTEISILIDEHLSEMEKG